MVPVSYTLALWWIYSLKKKLNLLTADQSIWQSVIKKISVKVFQETCVTHSRTSLLNGFLLFPRNSPIICRLRPFLCSRKWATPMGVSGMKPREIRNWRPLSGFLRQNRESNDWKGWSPRTELNQSFSIKLNWRLNSWFTL